MRKLNIILTIFTLWIAQLSVNAEEVIYNTNQLRSMFINNESIIYGLNIRTFNADDKNNDGIIDIDRGENPGTFINAIENLDALKQLGINTIHLLPITPVGKIKALGTAGSLYAIKDFTSINHQLKDKKSTLSLNDQARVFINECHKRNIRVVVDLPSCGSYDLYLKRPELFVLDKKQEPIIPEDWTDVRLFKVTNENGSLNQDLVDLHKSFIKFMMGLGVDGIRADVAHCKPYEFWKEIIDYARDKDPEFMFLAESSDSWSKAISKHATFTSYKDLLKAGFDGFYGSYFDYSQWRNISKLKNQVKLLEKSQKKYGSKKSVIGSFATHDQLSPILVGKANYSKTIMWLNATLPLNPYYIDGFTSGDKYLYKYGNKRAFKTYTDDHYYYVHKGKIDIFNFSRSPGGSDKDLVSTFFLSLKLRNFAKAIITQGKFKTFFSTNSKVFAYGRCYEDKSVIVITNKNFNEKVKATIKIRGINKDINMMPITFTNSPLVSRGKMKVELEPAETIVLYIDKFKI